MPNINDALYVESDNAMLRIIEKADASKSWKYEKVASVNLGRRKICYPWTGFARFAGFANGCPIVIFLHENIYPPPHILQLQNEQGEQNLHKSEQNPRGSASFLVPAKPLQNLCKASKTSVLSRVIRKNEPFEDVY